MKANYRINWKSGMRLSDAVFNASDEFHLSQLAPLYELMLRGGYGHLIQPRFRCDVDNQEMSVIEMNVKALSPAGELLDVMYSHNDRDLYQKMKMPESTEPFIVYLESTDNEFDSFTENDIPFRDKKYFLVLKGESANYVSRNAIAVARFEYKQCWMMDMSFIPPCISLHANADLWNLAHLYLKTLKELISSLRFKIDSEVSEIVVSLLPVLQLISIEIEKEIDEMSPKHMTTLMQQVVSIVSDGCELNAKYTLPDKDSCAAFVNANYNPTKIADLINEGIRLTQILNNHIGGFRQREIVVPEAAPMQPERREERVVHRQRDTSSQRISFRNKK